MLGSFVLSLIIKVTVITLCSCLYIRTLQCPNLYSTIHSLGLPTQCFLLVGVYPSLDKATLDAPITRCATFTVFLFRVTERIAISHQKLNTRQL